jgi:hypothetical protein
MWRPESPEDVTTKHRPHLLGILGEARGPDPIALQLLRQVHDLLHLVKHDSKLAQVRTEFRVHLQARVMSISNGNATAATVLPGLADFLAYVVRYIFDISSRQSIKEATDQLEAAAQNLMSHLRGVDRMQREQVLQNAKGRLLLAKEAAERCSKEYDAACKDVAGNGDAAKTMLLSLLTDATNEREPSLLGKLVVHSSPELFCKALEPLLYVKGGAPPLWLPASILDYAVIGLQLEDAGRVVEWLKTCLNSSTSHSSLCARACGERKDKGDADPVRH